MAHERLEIELRVFPMVFASSYDVKVFWRELFVTNEIKKLVVGRYRR